MPVRHDSGILGGVFALERMSAATAAPPFSAGNVQYFLSVRCALTALIEAHKPKTAWLPSYLCGDILTPFVRRNVAIRFYTIDARLRVSNTSWAGEIQRGDVVLVIHYFGFANGDFPAAAVASQGAILVEDASQALFLPQQFPQSLCILYSPRKFLGVPDSGILVAQGETGVESIKLEAPPLEWWREAVEVSLKRREFDLAGQVSGGNNWFAQFQRVESEFPVGLFGASDLSRATLSNVDYSAIRTRRRANYAKLLELTGQQAIFPELGAEVVPLGFPVQAGAGIRDQTLRKLHAARIFAPVHWPIEGIVPASFEESHKLSRGLITLVCDQRATLQDMQWQAGEFLASESAARGWSRGKRSAGPPQARETRARRG